MMKVAKLASRLNWRRSPDAPYSGTWPRFFLFTDQNRLPDPLADPAAVMARLPRGAAIVLRHTDPVLLAVLAQKTVAPAHALGLKVLVAGDARLAIRLRCDGVHLSQHQARRGPLRITGMRPGFLVTAAAHDAMSLRRAGSAGADMVVLSPVFATASHPEAKPLGPVRFARIAIVGGYPNVAVVALGGITARHAKRLSLGPAYGVAAVGAWNT